MKVISDCSLPKGKQNINLLVKWLISSIVDHLLNDNPERSVYGWEVI